jgi:hypothetical protein
MNHLDERGEPLRMQVICVWCLSDITKGDLGINTDLVSHGICQDCRNALPSREGVSLQQFIDSIPYPIVLAMRSLELIRSAHALG